MKMGMFKFFTMHKIEIKYKLCTMFHVPAGIFTVSFFKNQVFENSRSCSSSIHLLYTNSIPFFFATSSAC